VVVLMLTRLLSGARRTHHPILWGEHSRMGLP
jgi:hypothetical protein